MVDLLVRIVSAFPFGDYRDQAAWKQGRWYCSDVALRGGLIGPRVRLLVLLVTLDSFQYISVVRHCGELFVYGYFALRLSNFRFDLDA